MQYQNKKKVAFHGIEFGIDKAGRQSAGPGERIQVTMKMKYFGLVRLYVTNVFRA